MISRLLITAVLILGALLMTTNRVSSQTQNPASLVNAYIAAVNAQDVAAVLALFADNAVHEVVPPVPGTTGVSIGTAQIQQFYQQRAAGLDHLTLLGTPHVSGDKTANTAITFTLRLSSDSVRKLGLTTVDMLVVGVVALYDQGYKFTAYTAALTPQSLARTISARIAKSVPAVTEVRAFRLADAPAEDLPGGSATYQALHIIYPAGYTSKHVHGGPSYIYVISGVFQVIDDKGTRTYRAGTFDFEPPGHVHTFHVIQAGTEIFSLRFLPPGAQATIPVK